MWFVDKYRVSGNVELSKLVKLTKLRISRQLCVVYFDQRMHDCACVRMVENNRKRSKIIKTYFFSCVREAHVRLKRNVNKNILVGLTVTRPLQDP